MNKSPQQIVIIVLQIGLGVLVSFLAIGKIEDPQQFYTAILQYGIVSKELASILAVTIPWIELLTGVFLIIDVWTPYALFTLIISLCIFTGAQLVVIERGLSVECGCGLLPGMASKVSWLTVLRNLVLLSMCIMVFNKCGAIPNRILTSFRWKHKLAMVSIMLVVGIGLAFAGSYYYYLQHPTPPYAKSYTHALREQAIAEHRKIVIFFMSDSCSYCIEELDGPLKEPQLAARLSSEDITMLLVWKSDRSPLARQLIADYNILFYPSFVFLDTRGQLVSELIGYHTADDILLSINGLIDQKVNTHAHNDASPLAHTHE